MLSGNQEEVHDVKFSPNAAELHALHEDSNLILMHLLLAAGQARSQLLLQPRPQAIHPLVNGILQAIHLITVCSLLKATVDIVSTATLARTLMTWVTAGPIATAHSVCRMLQLRSTSCSVAKRVTQSRLQWQW